MDSVLARTSLAVARLAALITQAGTLPGGLPAALAAALAAILAPLVARRRRVGRAATRRSTS